MPKIMIVDDDATIQMELEEYLTHMDYNVVGIGDTGAGAVEMAREMKPDLILMDVNLPGEMDGISAARKIKTELNIPIVFITGYGDPEYIEKVKEIEPFGYVMKPFDEEEIRAFIEIALHKKAMELKLRKANEQLEQANRDLKQEIKERKQREEALRANEGRFSGMFEHMSSGVAVYESVDNGEDFMFRAFNPAAERITRISRSEALGNRLLDLFPHMDKAGLLGALQRVWKTGQEEHLPPFYYKDERREGWRENRIYRLPTGEVVALFDDVTERKRAEEALRESEERFRTVANFTYDWEYWIAPDGHCIYVSPSCERITGYSPDEFVNDPELFEKIVHPDDHSIIVNHLGEEQNLEKLPSIDYRIITRSGEVRWINHVCQAVYGADGAYLGRRGSNRDITKHKQMEAQLQQTNKMEAIATLAGGVAHEFNNALMGIIGTIELLKIDLPKDERQDKYFRAMNSSSYRMSRLTDQLLAYSRGGKYQPKNMKLDDFVIETLPILQHDLSAAVRVETHFPKNISYIRADNAQMQMVLSAILNNSNEAIADAGLIKITAENNDIDEDFAKQRPGFKPGSYVCIKIEDDGKGMNDKTRNRIFEPFFTTKFQGRGMGMAAVYGIVKNHDGYIYVDSELGKGTVVQIYLPAIGVGIKEQEPEEVKEPKGALATGEGTILVIEDEAVLLEMNRKILEKLGYRVLEAKTGREGIEIAETFDGQIDLALLDIKLPDMSGTQVYPLIMEARPDLKVVVCSGYSIDGLARKILDSGAEGFIQKPFLIAALAEKLKAVLNSD